METAKKRAARLGSGVRHTFWQAVLFGALTAAFLGAAFLFASTFLLYRLCDPLRYFPYVAAAGSLFLSFLGGYRAAKLYQASGVLPGISVGLILSFLFLVSALILTEGSLPLTALPLYLGMLLSATLGGVASTRKRARRRRHR